MKKSETQQVYQLVFGSMAEAIEYAEKTPIDPGYGYTRGTEVKREPEWAGVSAWEELPPLSRRGLVEEGKKIAEQSLSLGSLVFSSIPAPDVGYDVEGQVFDMGRFIRGEPECCLQLEKEGEGIQRSLKVVSNLSVSSCVDSSLILRRGIACASLVRSLEALRVGVEVWSVSPYFRSGREFRFWIKVKSAGEILSLNHLAFALCSPAVHRCLGLRIAETLPMRFVNGIQFYLNGGYGKPISLEDMLEQTIFPVKNFLELPGAGSGKFDTDESAFAWLKDIVAGRVGRGIKLK